MNPEDVGIIVGGIPSRDSSDNIMVRPAQFDPRFLAVMCIKALKNEVVVIA